MCYPLIISHLRQKVKIWYNITMKKINTSPISGMLELLPSEQAIFNKFKSGIAKAYHLHGFQNIETPTIDRNEVLFAKAGGDTEKQIYRVIKTEESAEDSSQSLRYDHTVPLARYIVEHESSLAFPFRVSQIGRNFRGERAQKARFREFYQCDVDVIGRGELPLSYDAEVIATVVDALRTFNLPSLKVRVNNRKFLSGVLDFLVVSAHASDIMSIIDHAEKVPAEKTDADLKSLGLPEETVVKITTFINTHGSAEDIKKLDFIDFSDPRIAEGFAELEYVMNELGLLGLSDIAEADMKIVRGLDYYTGTVFETIIPGYEQLGSICSGGRYDNLASNYTDQSFPGVGGSIGLTRLYAVLSEAGLLKESAPAPVDIAIMMLGDTRESAYKLADKLRASGKSVDVILFDKKLGDLMRHAARIAKSGVVVGENEVKTGKYLLKDFTTGEQKPLEI